jgi:hypothetical protein
MTTHIRVWPDNDWEFVNADFPNLLECKSDDFQVVEVPVNALPGAIERFIELYNTQPDMSAHEYWVAWLNGY